MFIQPLAAEFHFPGLFALFSNLKKCGEITLIMFINSNFIKIKHFPRRSLLCGSTEWNFHYWSHMGSKQFPASWKSFQYDLVCSKGNLVIPFVKFPIPPVKLRGLKMVYPQQEFQIKFCSITVFIVTTTQIKVAVLNYQSDKEINQA